MNLKGFKKIHEDDKKAVLQNQRGHQITLAKAQLSKNHVDSLGRLPLYGGGTAETPDEFDPDKKQSVDYSSKPLPGDAPAPQQADTSPVPKPPDESVSHHIGRLVGQYGVSPVIQGVKDTVDAYKRIGSAAGDVFGGVQQGSGMEEVPDQEPQPAQPQPDNQAPPQDQAPEQQPATASAEQGGQQPQPQGATPPQQQPKTISQELSHEDAAWENDLNNGHITPQTYSSLFAKKDTLGKMGTLFGLLFSGAGSGLAHQPNAILEMMNKEIQNDLEAQKTSKTNAVNYLTLNSENELRKAQAKNYGAQSELTNAETQLRKQTMSLNQMGIAALHNVQTGIVNPMPEGQRKQGAQQVLNSVKQVAAVDRAHRNAMTESQYTDTANALRTAGIGGNSAFTQKGEDMESKYLPGVGYSNKKVPPETLDRVKKIKEFNDLLNEYERLGGKAGWRGNIGVLTPSEKARATSIRNDLISSYNDVKGLTRFTGNEEELYKNIVPHIGKMNLTGSQLDLLHRLRSSIGEKSNRELEAAGITQFAGGGGQASNSQFSEGQIGKEKSTGRQTIFRNGSWGYRP